MEFLMRERIQSRLPVKSIENYSPHNVLGEFQIDDQQFLLIGLDNCLLSCLPAYQSTSFVELCRFEIYGQLCAIVKVNQHPNQIEIDFAILLTERELQIATLVALGRPNKQIASQLHISEWTVSTHLRRIFIKLGVDSRAAMVYRCASLIQQLRGTQATNESVSNPTNH